MIKQLKRFMALPSLLAGLAATATGADIWMSDFEIDSGGSAMVELTLRTDDDETFDYSGFQFNLFLPEGLIVEKFGLDSQLSEQSFTLDVTHYDEGAYRIVAFTNGTGKASAELMQILFRAAGDMTEGQSKVLMQSVVFSAPDGQDIALNDSEAIVTFRRKEGPDIPDNPFGSAETPLQLVRKGNGTSCTFICMMPLPNEQLETAGYKFTFGYDSIDGLSHLLADTPLRYCHTTEQTFNDPSLDFWVFAYYTDAEGKLCVSSRRHLDGSLDEDFDPSDFISATKSDTRSDVQGVFTLDGRYIGRDASRLDRGIYIHKTADGSVKFIK